jgi:hypothetical protein
VFGTKWFHILVLFEDIEKSNKNANILRLEMGASHSNKYHKFETGLKILKKGFLSCIF